MSIGKKVVRTWLASGEVELLELGQVQVRIVSSGFPDPAVVQEAVDEVVAIWGVDRYYVIISTHKKTKEVL